MTPPARSASAPYNRRPLRRHAPRLTRSSRWRRAEPVGWPVPGHRRARDDGWRNRAMRRAPSGRLDVACVVRVAQSARPPVRPPRPHRDQQGRSPGERHPCGNGFPVPKPFHERANGGGRHEVAGRVVQRLHGKRNRAIGAAPFHAGRGDAGRHLHKTVEPAPSSPWAGPAVGVEADLDQSRPDGARAPPQRDPARRGRPAGSRGPRGRPRPGGARNARGPRVVRRSSRAQRLPSVTSGSTPGSSQSGGSMRKTSAP